MGKTQAISNVYSSSQSCQAIDFLNYEKCFIFKG